MKITVRIETSSETAKVYDFNCFDTNIVFVAYSEEVKPSGKRKWRIVKFWDNYNKRDSSIKEAPDLPLDVRQLAAVQMIEMIKVMTWNEWKPLR